MTIKVKLQQNGDWKISARQHGGLPATRHTATSAYRFVEKRLKRLLAQGETAVLVDYGQSLINETLTSSNYAQVMYAFTLFLEDYLKPDFSNQRSTHYLTLLNTRGEPSVKTSPGVVKNKNGSNPSSSYGGGYQRQETASAGNERYL